MFQPFPPQNRHQLIAKLSFKTAEYWERSFSKNANTNKSSYKQLISRWLHILTYIYIYTYIAYIQIYTHTLHMYIYIINYICIYNYIILYVYIYKSHRYPPIHMTCSIFAANSGQGSDGAFGLKLQDFDESQGNAPEKQHAALQKRLKVMELSQKVMGVASTIIHFTVINRRMFHYIPSSYWGSPIYGHLQIWRGLVTM